MFSLITMTDSQMQTQMQTQTIIELYENDEQFSTRYARLKVATNKKNLSEIMELLDAFYKIKTDEGIQLIHLCAIMDKLINIRYVYMDIPSYSYYYAAITWNKYLVDSYPEKMTYLLQIDEMIC